MEVIRKFIDANSLMSIMTLPEAFRNQKLEIIVLPANEPEQTSEEQTKDIQSHRTVLGWLHSTYRPVLE